MVPEGYLHKHRMLPRDAETGLVCSPAHKSQRQIPKWSRGLSPTFHSQMDLVSSLAARYPQIWRICNNSRALPLGLGLKAPQ